jgi:ParB family chromosome partitioning protein
MKLLGLQEKDVQTAEVRQIPIDLIVLNPYQPRKQFYEESLQELADSIRNFGVIQPILVRRKDDQYELIAGERRLRASKLAGLALVPAIVTDYSNQEMAEVALVENLQREDLGFMDEAEGYRLLIDEFGITQEELARRVGKSQSTIANKLRLLRLPDNVRQNISQEIITERHVRALLKLKNDKQQIEVLNEIYEKKLNVRETEDLIEKVLEPPLSEKGKKKDKGQKVIRIVRDARILINTVRQLVKDMQNSGVPIQLEEIDGEERFQVVISIAKKKAAAK